MGVGGFSMSIKNQKTLNYLGSAEAQIKTTQKGIKSGFFWLGKESHKLMGLATLGAKHGRWYRYNRTWHRASAPGEAPANRSGKLVRTSMFTVQGHTTCSFGYTQPYGLWLEKGTKKRMKKRPNLIPVAQKTGPRSLRKFENEWLMAVKNRLSSV